MGEASPDVGGGSVAGTDPRAPGGSVAGTDPRAPGGTVGRGAPAGRINPSGDGRYKCGVVCHSDAARCPVTA